MKNNIEKVKMIEDAFSNYLQDGNQKEFEKVVSSILSSFSSKRFTVSIIEGSYRTREPFYGMRVFPAPEYADALVKHMSTDKDVSFKTMVERWRHIDEWVIEIDDRCFDRAEVSFNPGELTAMLLHEVGHTTYSDQKVEVLYRAFKECSIRLTIEDHAVQRIMYRLYLIPLTLVCGIRNWGVTSRDMREEIFADMSVEKIGYGDQLVSAYSKIIKAYGSGGYVSENQADTDARRSMDFVHVNMKDLRHRRDKLKDELYSTGATHKSNYIQDMVSSLMTSLGIYKRDRYNGSIVLEAYTAADFDPSFLETHDVVYDLKTFNALEQSLIAVRNKAKAEIAEEAFGRKKNELQIPTQLEVDTIYVEVDRIENHADRRFVLDLIYNEQEKINHFLEICEQDKQMKSKYAGKMKSMLRELDEMRAAVLSKRSFDKNYKVFVKYPPGYEG